VTKVYEKLARELIALKPGAVFGFMGEDTAALTTELALAGVPYYAVRHESAAVGMADGYSWATGGLGIAMVTRGPGLLNAVNAARTAVRGGRRVLLLAGDAVSTGEWQHDYKYIDQAPVAGSIGLGYFGVDAAARAVPALREAVAQAMSGRPALLAVAVDVLHGPATREPAPAPAPAAASAPVEFGPPSAADVDAAAELLARARSPLILAGRGASAPEMRRLVLALAERLGALVGTTLLNKDAFRGHPYSLGVVGGFASDAARDFLDRFDCVLVLGASLTPHTTGQRTLFRDVPIIQVDVDAARLGANHPIALGIRADAGAVAGRLLEMLPERVAKPLHDPAALARLQRPLYGGADESTGDELDPRSLVQALDEILPEERAVILDSGRFMTSPGRFLRVPGPECFRITAEGGSIGLGCGIALGAAVARPALTTVLFVGDGGMMIALPDLETAARHAIPLVVVVMNDHGYGAERVHLQADGITTELANFPVTDIAPAAAALGVEAETVRTVAELRALQPRLADRKAPILLDCKIRPDITAERLRWGFTQAH
jgi:thiamine pyrophosphate-dependent acetolactate synthase large subunit-like protein